MLHSEIIEFGNVNVFADIASVFELYERLGILDRLHEGDIVRPDDIQFHAEDYVILKRLIDREARRRRNFIWGRAYFRTVNYEWYNFGPGTNGSRRGVVEITSKK